MYQTGIESPELESILHLMYVGGGKFYEDRRGEYVRAATELEIEQISDNDMTYVHWRGKNIYKEEGAIHQSYKLPEIKFFERLEETDCPLLNMCQRFMGKL